MAKSPRLPIALDQETRAELEALAARWRCSLAAVLRKAVADAHRKELGPASTAS